MDNGFEYDPETHTYWLNGKPIVSVTEALGAVNVPVSRRHMRGYLERGRRVHRACHLLDENDLDWNTVREGEAGYVLAWEKWKEQTEVEFTAIEEKFYKKLIGGFTYAGRPDRVGILIGAGLYAHDKRKYETIIDLKTGDFSAPLPSVALQLAGYGYGLNSRKIYRRIAVQLRYNGKPKVFEYPMKEYRSDVQDFFAVLRTKVWQERCK